MRKSLFLDGSTLWVRKLSSLLHGPVGLIKPRGRPKGVPLALDDLRLVFMVSYFDFKYKFFANTTSESVSVLDLDDLGAKEQASVFETLQTLLQSAKNYELGKVHICLADFGKNSSSFTLLDLKRSKVDIFGPLAAASPVRRKKRAEWLKGNPNVTLMGGGTAVVDASGFTKGNKFLSWAEIATIQIYVQDTGLFKSASLLMIPHGVNTGAYGMKKFKYSLRSIKKDRLELYYAECFFWMLLAQNKGKKSGLTERLTTLKGLLDQGAISEEKYQQAKAKALEELT
jgi:hypothetical protein